MKNTLVFDQFDMVVAMTQRLINDQLTHLMKMGVIKSEFILVQKDSETDAGDYVYEILNDRADIPRDKDGEPLCPYIDGQIHPQIAISETGMNVSFVLEFRGGDACFWHGKGRKAVLKKYDMTGWKYGISIGMDLAKLEKDRLDKDLAVPDLVKNQLHNFMDSMFTVNHLFMDFESVDLMNFDPTKSDAKDAGDEGLEQLADFMKFYLMDLMKSGNPFILGYSINVNDQTKVPDDQNLAPELKPVGTTFSMYYDSANEDLSSLNFVLATQGGHGRITGSAPLFDSNWITPQEQCDAKMVYSHACLIEPFFLKPLFDQMHDKVYAQIKDHINVQPGNDYNAAKKALGDGTGFKFDISNQNTGNDQYVNGYTVKIQAGPSSVELQFAGQVSLHKEVSTNYGFCTGTADTSATFEWDKTISLIASVNQAGKPELKVNQGALNLKPPSVTTDMNDCAKAFKVIAGILDTLLTPITAIFDLFGGHFLDNLFDDLFGMKFPGVGDIGVVFSNLSNAIQTVIMLPAGQVFYFKNPSADEDGNFALELTYKSDN